ncbi:MAG: hypothetical protein K2X81_22755 [Candidatus Obscuribacterales bacterium]|nr:hypothetical protein [Candidatus Obscuribacterales bacterium]
MRKKSGLLFYLGWNRASKTWWTWQKKPGMGVMEKRLTQKAINLRVIIPLICIGCLGIFFVQSANSQESTDLKLKQQVYSVKFPWEHLLPYGDLCGPVNSRSVESNNDDSKLSEASQSCKLGDIGDESLNRDECGELARAIKQLLIKLSSNERKTTSIDESAEGTCFVGNRKISNIHFEKYCASPLLNIQLQATMRTVQVRRSTSRLTEYSWTFTNTKGVPEIRFAPTPKECIGESATHFHSASTTPQEVRQSKVPSELRGGDQIRKDIRVKF